MFITIIWETTQKSMYISDFSIVFDSEQTTSTDDSLAKTNIRALSESRKEKTYMQIIFVQIAGKLVIF